MKCESCSATVLPVDDAGAIDGTVDWFAIAFDNLIPVYCMGSPVLADSNSGCTADKFGAGRMKTLVRCLAQNSRCERYRYNLVDLSHPCSKALAQSALLLNKGDFAKTGLPSRLQYQYAEAAMPGRLLI